MRAGLFAFAIVRFAEDAEGQANFVFFAYCQHSFEARQKWFANE
jgi:hypothetical protein